MVRVVPGVVRGCVCDALGVTMKRVFLGFILAFAWGGGAQAVCPTGAVAIAAGASIQAAVDANPAGTKFCLAVGEWRGQSAVPKNNQGFYGASGAPNTQLVGSMVLPAWVAEGSIWYAAHSANPPTTNINECAPGFPFCNEAMAVYWDTLPVTRKATKAEVVACACGWWRDVPNGRIYVGKTPINHTMEVTTTESAFSGSASGVHIQDLTVTRYGPRLQRATIHGADGSGWTIFRVGATRNYAVGIDVGSGSSITKSGIHNNGEMGLAGNGTGLVVEDNNINNNGGWAGLDPAWEGGGGKWTEVYGTFTTVNGVVKGTGLDFRGNTVCNNKSVGMWVDEGTATQLPNSGIVIANNTICNNDSAGISIEISLGPVEIYGNTLTGNGVTAGWLWGGCLQAYDSANVEAYGNTCDVSASHGNGMMVISQGGRIANSASGCGNNFHDNTIIYRGSEGVSGATGDDLATFCGSNQNQFNHNAYFVADQADLTRLHWAWQDDERTWSQFQSLGLEAQGSATVGLPSP